MTIDARATTANPAAIIAIPEANVTALRLFLFSLMAIGRIEKILQMTYAMHRTIQSNTIT